MAKILRYWAQYEEGEFQAIPSGWDRLTARLRDVVAHLAVLLGIRRIHP